MIKAAFFDIDGTLLSFHTHRVSEGTIRAFDRMHRAGIRTFISTGRPMVLIPQLPLRFDGYVTMNGGLVFSGDTTLVANPIPLTDSERWLDYAAIHGLCTMYFTANSMLAAQANSIGEDIHRQLDIPLPPVVPLDQLRGIQPYQIIAVMPPSADAEVATFMPSCRMPRWSPLFTDIVASANDKSVGMDALCRHFGIDRSETIAFGDGGNDIEMLRWAGTGIAMGNAAPDVQAYADLVTLDVDHEGIEHAIDQLLPTNN